MLAAQCPSPINAEFRQIVGEYNMGKPLEQTLREASSGCGARISPSSPRR